MADTLLEIQSVSKKYCRDLHRSLRYGLFDLAKEMLGRPAGQNLRPKEFWALNGISFELKRGQCLGLIGGNGAGKSTLLKIISGLVKPTRGRVTIRGQLQALIELGAGFHPVLTGRENIFINAAVLGIPKEHVVAKLDEIIEFAEIGDFIDAPVQTYSSGMRVRLGFSVALHMDPDVILIDEVLAVGDAKFRRKAKNAMEAFLSEGRAVIFVSHNMHQVLGVADRILWLDAGTPKCLGDPAETSQQYLLSTTEQSDLPGTNFKKLHPHKITGECQVVSATLHGGSEVDGNGRFVSIPPQSVGLELGMTFRGNESVDEEGQHGFLLVTESGESVACSILKDHIMVDKKTDTKKIFKLQIPNLHPGNYKINYILNQNGGMMFDGVDGLVRLAVKPYAEDTPTRYLFERMTLASRDGHGFVKLPIQMESPQTCSHGN